MLLSGGKRAKPQQRIALVKAQEPIQFIPQKIAPHAQNHPDPLWQRRGEQVHQRPAAGDLLEPVQQQDSRSERGQQLRQPRLQAVQILRRGQPRLVEDAVPKAQQITGEL